MRTNEYRQLLQEIAKNSFFLRRKVRIQQLTYKLFGRANIFCLKQI